MKLGELEIDLDELKHFVVKAKKACYSGHGKKSRTQDGSKLIIYQEGNFYFTNSYAGRFLTAGNEIVRWQKIDGQRIWQLNYSGGLARGFLDYKDLLRRAVNFHKIAMANVSFFNPFRGPETRSAADRWSPFSIDDLEYINEGTKGDFSSFHGEDGINWIQGTKKTLLFRQFYHGGIILP